MYRTKTAQKIIIELKDKLKLDEVFESALSKNKKADNNSNVSNVMMIRNDAVEALVSLGYSSKDATCCCQGSGRYRE